MAFGDAFGAIGAPIASAYVKMLKLQLQRQWEQQDRMNQQRASLDQWREQREFADQLDQQREQRAQSIQEQRDARAKAEQEADPVYRLRRAQAEAGLSSLDQPQQTVNVPGVGVVPLDQAVKLIGAEGVRGLAGIQTPQQQAQGERDQFARTQVERKRTVDQLRTKMVNAVRNDDRAMAQRVAQQFDRIAGTHGTGDGVTEFRQAQEMVGKEKRTAAGQTLQQQSARVRIERGGRSGGGGTPTLARQKAELAARYRRDPESLSPQDLQILFGRGRSGASPDKLESDIAAAEAQLAALTQQLGANPMNKYDQSLARQIRNAEVRIQVLNSRRRTPTRTPSAPSAPSRTQPKKDDDPLGIRR